MLEITALARESLEYPVDLQKRQHYWANFIANTNRRARSMATLSKELGLMADDPVVQEFAVEPLKPNLTLAMQAETRTELLGRLMLLRGPFVPAAEIIQLRGLTKTDEECIEADVLVSGVIDDAVGHVIVQHYDEDELPPLSDEYRRLFTSVRQLVIEILRPPSDPLPRSSTE